MVTFMEKYKRIPKEMTVQMAGVKLGSRWPSQL